MLHKLKIRRNVTFQYNHVRTTWVCVLSPTSNFDGFRFVLLIDFIFIF